MIMTFNVRNREIEPVLRELGEKIGAKMPEGWGFSLLIFDYGKESNTGSMFYISSAQREDMIKAMKEFIRKNEH